MKYISLFFICMSVASCKTESLQSVLNEGSKFLMTDNGKPSRGEIGLGLKEALSLSIEKGAKSLALKDGFLKNQAVKILLPPEVQQIQGTLRKIGLGALSNELTVRLNRAAEDAAMKSVPIFKKAIVGMSFSDVMSVLTGQGNAATTYLKKETSAEILSAFAPQIANSLNKVGAASLWKEIFSKYNRVPFVKKVNPDLVRYTSERALSGLFVSVSNRENLIRKSLNSRSTPLLRKVFGYADMLKK